MQKKQEKYSIVWFRNDLRIDDNASLAAAIATNLPIIGVYCYDPRHYEVSTYGFKKTAKYRAKFLIETVNDLKKQLSLYNIPLLTFFDTPELVIATVCKNYEVATIFYQEEWTSEETKVADTIFSVIPKETQIEKTYSQFLYHPEQVNELTTHIPYSFTSFRKKMEKYLQIQPQLLVELAKQQSIPIESEFITLETLGFSNFIVDARTAFPFLGGETQAKQRIQSYFFETKRLAFYKKTRNGLLGTDYSSKLSPWLANGSVSPKMIYWKVKEFEKAYSSNESTYWLIFELIWRDFFKYVSMQHENAIFQLAGIQHKEIHPTHNPELVASWINGTTDDDFVNANMIELQLTGWMSNRGRQNVASYFVKELKQDWRVGAAYFEAMLLDYDVHSNYGNWMYVAGVGNDSRDRTFNTQLQAERYDAKKMFRRKWLQTNLQFN